MGEDILTKDCKVNPGSKSKVQMASQELDLSFVKQKLESFQNSILKDVDKKMTIMIDDILQEIRQRELQTHEFNDFAKRSNNNTTYSNRLSQNSQNQSAKSENKDNTSPRKRALPDKVFAVRESYLTALLEIDHMKSIYNIFFIILTVFLLNSVCYDLFVLGRLNFGLSTMKVGLRGIHQVMGIWSLMHIPVLGLFYAFKMWANVRQRLEKNQSIQALWSYSCLAALITFQISLLYVGTKACLIFDLPYVPGAVMLLETTRIMMKVHGFVRTNAGRVLSGKLKTDDENNAIKTVQMPPFSSYLYYLFAPTLIYCDSYPRTHQIRWLFALNRSLEVVAVAFLYSHIYERHIHVHFSNYGIEELTNASLLVKIFGMMMPGFVIMLAAFYMILHSWLNFTGEILRFGDRMFYKDWWTASSYEAFYRNWNVVVHDWLYEYVYKDAYNHIFKGSKVASSLLVFFLSAYMHEHIIGFALQMFYPVMFLNFGCVGVGLVFLTKDLSPRFGNLVLWFTLITGSSFMISLYSMEYYARQNCPSKEITNWIDWITPVSWVCNGMK